MPQESLREFIYYQGQNSYSRNFDSLPLEHHRISQEFSRTNHASNNLIEPEEVKDEVSNNHWSNNQLLKPTSRRITNVVEEDIIDNGEQNNKQDED